MIIIKQYNKFLHHWLEKWCLYEVFPGKLESCLPYVDICDRRHETDGWCQQPVLWMRSETGQQHVYHQAPALNLPQLVLKDSPKEEGATVDGDRLTQTSGRWTLKCPIALWLNVHQEGHHRGRQGWPHGLKKQLRLTPINAAINCRWCLLLCSRVMSDIGDWPDFCHVQGTLPPSTTQKSM